MQYFRKPAALPVGTFTFVQKTDPQAAKPETRASPEISSTPHAQVQMQARTAIAVGNPCSFSHPHPHPAAFHRPQATAGDGRGPSALSLRPSFSFSRLHASPALIAASAGRHPLALAHTPQNHVGAATHAESGNGFSVPQWPFPVGAATQFCETTGTSRRAQNNDMTLPPRRWLTSVDDSSYGRSHRDVLWGVVSPEGIANEDDSREEEECGGEEEGGVDESDEHDQTQFLSKVSAGLSKLQRKKGARGGGGDRGRRPTEAPGPSPSPTKGAEAVRRLHTHTAGGNPTLVTQPGRSSPSPILQPLTSPRPQAAAAAASPSASRPERSTTLNRQTRTEREKERKPVSNLSENLREKGKKERGSVTSNKVPPPQSPRDTAEKGKKPKEKEKQKEKGLEKHPHHQQSPLSFSSPTHPLHANRARLPLPSFSPPHQVNRVPTAVVVSSTKSGGGRGESEKERTRTSKGKVPKSMFIIHETQQSSESRERRVTDCADAKETDEGAGALAVGDSPGGRGASLRTHSFNTVCAGGGHEMREAEVLRETQGVGRGGQKKAEIAKNTAASLCSGKPLALCPVGCSSSLSLLGGIATEEKEKRSGTNNDEDMGLFLGLCDLQRDELIKSEDTPFVVREREAALAAECAALRRCDHPHVVKLKGNLAAFLSECPSLDVAIRLKIAKQMASALHHLHALRPALIHRDVKPSNFLIRSSADSESRVPGLESNTDTKRGGVTAKKGHGQANERGTGRARTDGPPQTHPKGSGGSPMQPLPQQRRDAVGSVPPGGLSSPHVVICDFGKALSVG
eukprot:Cvel_26870.t1-p1 / transcript=Cvel_26870.t1 / gene=Cvel_26870 / organism=Chromera_velia_CCMP2878 / gene_product=hypothetical protein / transcript_product=hypothetical protein / location=Cvel_scaffold3262:281-5726(-) / protein_length=797 / sequence_SO=supercontig / SO=protein_coding / is_pseudo=false